MSGRLQKKSTAEKRVIVFSAAVALVVLMLDVLTKLWVIRSFELFESRELIPGILNFTSVRNQGAAWSILSGHVWLLFSIALIAAILILIFFRKICEGFTERYFALALLLAGIIGNGYDRAFRGCVVDFIHVHWQNIWHYPVFNVADIAICSGVGLMVLSNLLRKTDDKSDEKK